MTAPRKGSVVVLAGTRKGAFVFRSDARRKSWSVEGPHFAGGTVTKGGVRYEQDSGLYVECVWHVRPGRASEPGAERLLCGFGFQLLEDFVLPPAPPEGS